MFFVVKMGTNYFIKTNKKKTYKNSNYNRVFVFLD